MKSSKLLFRNPAAILSLICVGSLALSSDAGAATATWNGATNGSWDTTTSNWGVAGGGATYTSGDDVQFSDTGALNTTISIATPVTPNSVQFIDGGAGALAYIFNTSAINGATSLTLNSGFGGSVRLNVANGYTGGTTLAGGTLNLGAGGALGSGTVTLAGGTLTNALTVTLSNNIVAQAGTTTAIANTGGGNLTLTGALSGSGNITRTQVSGVPLTLYMGGNNAAYSGTFTMTNNASAVVRFTNTNAGSANATWVFDQAANNTRTTLEFAGTGTISFGAFRGNGYLNTGASGVKTIKIGDLNRNDIFSGQLLNTGAGGTIAVTKSGSGAQLFSRAAGNDYTAGTTVNAGTLLVANTSNSGLGTGAVSVDATGALGGTGIVAPTGANGISVSGVLTPGGTVSGENFASGIGTLTFNLANTTGKIQMLSGASFRMELDSEGLSLASAGISDHINITGASAGDLALNSNLVDFAGTGAEGYYMLVDTSLADNAVFSGLTFDSITGVVSSGLTGTNLTDGLEATFIVGTASNGGNVGDLYVQVVPEPSVAALLGAMSGTLLLFRRRKSRIGA